MLKSVRLIRVDIVKYLSQLIIKIHFLIFKYDMCIGFRMSVFLMISQQECIALSTTRIINPLMTYEIYIFGSIIKTGRSTQILQRLMKENDNA